MNGVCKLVENVKHLSNELQLARRKIYEMEYGLRVAQKSLQKSLDMNKKEMTDE